MKAKDILEDLIERYPGLAVCKEDIWLTYEAWIACFDRKGKLMICGNGGSEADSQHIVGELMKEFCLKRPKDGEFAEKLKNMFPEDNLSENLQTPLSAIALGSSQVLTSAYSNDVEPKMIFAQEVFGYGRKNDILLALSTSGISDNVLNAVKVAKAMGLTTIGICGSGTGKNRYGKACLKEICDICIKIPERETYLVQEATLPVYHALCRMIEIHYWNREERENDPWLEASVP